MLAMNFSLSNAEELQMARRLALSCALAAVVLVAAVASSGAASAVSVTAGKPSELRFTLSKKTVPAGAVTFTVTNKGVTKHDFKIGGRKTKLIATGKKATLKVTLKKGRYSYVCTVPGHADAGMKGTLKVR
jgi:uncharacterized cupredoxin-like copper-binding protein